MPPMRRTTMLAFVILGAALAGFAFSSAAGRLDDDPAPAKRSVAAAPQVADLHWRETYGPAGSRLIFEVARLQVLRTGWRVSLAVTNKTPVSYELGDPAATIDRAFGLMLFSTGDDADFERRNANLALPSTRPAVRYKPSLPPILEPGASWRGTISARGSLVAGSWVRVVFGTLVVVGAANDTVDPRIVWITDHAYRLLP
jgi:hypothetical protein